jgi:DNA-binding response OmpR family regulator
MTAIEGRNAQRVLLVDDDVAVSGMMKEALLHSGFEVVVANSVTDALANIATAPFDALITDLHMPGPGDGFTVISAMRHSQPNALTLLVSGFPDVQGAMASILLEVDEIMVKPLEMVRIPGLVRERLLNRIPAKRPEKETVAVILKRCSTSVVERWLSRAKQSIELNHLALSDEQRAGHLSKLVGDLVVRLGKNGSATKDSDATSSEAAVAHGELRYRQGYTPAMLVHESRILQVTIFGTLKDNLKSLDFSLLLPDVMAIADEVDAQLTQSMESFMALLQPKAA